MLNGFRQVLLVNEEQFRPFDGGLAVPIDEVVPKETTHVLKTAVGGVILRLASIWVISPRLINFCRHFDLVLAVGMTFSVRPCADLATIIDGHTSLLQLEDDS